MREADITGSSILNVLPGFAEKALWKKKLIKWEGVGKPEKPPAVTWQYSIRNSHCLSQLLLNVSLLMKSRAEAADLRSVCPAFLHRIQEQSTLGLPSPSC